MVQSVAVPRPGVRLVHEYSGLIQIFQLDIFLCVTHSFSQRFCDIIAPRQFHRIAIGEGDDTCRAELKHAVRMQVPSSRDGVTKTLESSEFAHFRWLK